MPRISTSNRSPFRSLTLVVTMLVAATFASTVPVAAHPGHEATPTADAAIAISAEDFTFDMPAELQAGYVTFTLTNNGNEDHHAQLLKLNDGVTGDNLLAAMETDGEAAITELATLAGGPALTAPGEESTATVRLDAGNYIAICLVPGTDGVPHLAKGMVHEFSVTGDVQGSEPTADETVTMRDFGYTAPAEVPAGVQTWQVINDGPQPHELVVRRLDDGVTFDQLVSDSVAIAPATPSGASHDHNGNVSPIADMTTAVGGVQAVPQGGTAWFTADLEPGTYVIICHVPDPSSGKEHAELGMIQELTVH